MCLKLHGGKKIYINVYIDCYTSYHNRNQMVLQILILIGKKKLYCADFYSNLPKRTIFKVM